MPTNCSSAAARSMAVVLLAPVPRGAEDGAGHRGLVPGVGADDDVLQRRHLAPQPDVLEGAGDPATGDLVALDPAQRCTVEGHRTRGGPVHTGDGVEAGGLARAVGPDQAEDLAALDVEADRVQGGQTAELDGEILGRQQGFAFGGLHLAVQGGQFLVDGRSRVVRSFRLRGIGHAAAFESSAPRSR